MVNGKTQSFLVIQQGFPAFTSEATGKNHHFPRPSSPCPGLQLSRTSDGPGLGVAMSTFAELLEQVNARPGDLRNQEMAKNMGKTWGKHGKRWEKMVNLMASHDENHEIHDANHDPAIAG